MSNISARCTRSEFHQLAHKLSSETLWELRSSRDVFGGTLQHLEATYNTPPSDDTGDSSLLVTVYIVYHPDFRVPQLGFLTSSLHSMDELRGALPNLCFTNAILETRDAASAAAESPLVSCSWNDEVLQHMWLVHPCDTETLIRRRRYDGMQGDLLRVFVRAMSAYFPFAPALLPPA